MALKYIKVRKEKMLQRRILYELYIYFTTVFQKRIGIFAID